VPEEEDDRGWNWEQEEAEYTYGHLGEGELEDDADSREPVEGELGYDQDRGENLRGSSDSKLMGPPKEYPTALRFLVRILYLIFLINHEMNVL
jgi:hypothetical protein